VKNPRRSTNPRRPNSTKVFSILFALACLCAAAAALGNQPWLSLLAVVALLGALLASGGQPLLWRA
jgi:hypothetical protein